ncbi:MAG: 4Fe-4S binding protein, partial [Acidobacteriota bacterium]
MNIELMTLSELERVEGELGNFTVTLRRRPRYVDMERCLACGECARVCPKSVKDEFNEGLTNRKAAYIKYPQAVPHKYQIDPDHCIRLSGDRCGACLTACPSGAISFDETETMVDVSVGSIILAPGFSAFDPSGIRTWGYGVFPNVLTTMELERYLLASGPSRGRLVRPSDGEPVKRLAFLQCVGSRDYNKSSHGYCSSTCCMSALKQAMIAMDHVKDLEVSIFFTDMRAHWKDFERYYERARERGVKFHRCRVHSLEPVGTSGDIYFRYITDDGKQVKAEFDMVVLSIGMQPPAEVEKLAEVTGVALNDNGFAVTPSFAPAHTSRPGIYACGAFLGPMEIAQTVIRASAAASSAALPLSNVRHSIARQKEFPAERDVNGEEVRIGVFICHCGSNIAGVIDVEAVARYAATLPGVVYVERSLFSCSQDSQELLR